MGQAVRLYPQLDLLETSGRSEHGLLLRAPELLPTPAAGQTTSPLRGSCEPKTIDREIESKCTAVTICGGTRDHSIIERDQKSASRHQIGWPCSPAIWTILRLLHSRRPGIYAMTWAAFPAGTRRPPLFLKGTPSVPVRESRFVHDWCLDEP